jgi:membrane-associated phospholipid phosphatase
VGIHAVETPQDGDSSVVLLYFIAAFAVIVPAVLGPLLAYRPGRRIARSRVAARTRLALEGLIGALGRPVTAIVAVLAFSAAVIAVFWPIGVLAHRLENVVDWPVLLWVTDRRNPDFEQVNWFYTALGDRYPLKWVTVVGALLFAAIWLAMPALRKRFWLPLVAILAAFPLEQYVQSIVGSGVNRGHPPTGLGSYPSGGIARVVMTFGAIALFVALTWKMGRRWHVLLGTVVLIMATYEGYSRIYTQKHWLTDVISGLIFGPALFLGYALAVGILVGRYPRPAPTPAAVTEAVAAPAAAPVATANAS